MSSKNLYPTQYSNRPAAELKAMFRHSVWQNLSESEKISLLQETVNRESAEKGIEPCRVVLEKMPVNERGYQTDNVIALNKDMVVSGELSYDFGGTTLTYNLHDSNYLAYETVIHETEHSYQDNVIKGKVSASEAEKMLYESNDFTVSTVSGKRGLQYMKGVTDYDLYYLNPTELAAHKAGQEKTLALISEHKALFGEDGAAKAYLKENAENGFNARIAEIKAKYGENAVGETAKVLHNAYYGTNLPVDKNIEKSVHAEMAASLNPTVSNAAAAEAEAFDKAQTETQNAVQSNITVNASVGPNLTAENGSIVDGGVEV